MTEERKQELLQKFSDRTLTDEELREFGGEEAILDALMDYSEEIPRGNRHVYSPGKFSKWVD